MIASSPARPVAARRSDVRQLAHRAHRDRGEQAAVAVDVVVERRRADAELRGDARERDRVESVGVGDRDRRVDDLLPVQAAARHAMPPRAIARSISAPGCSTTLPCPVASQAGSSARRLRADASAVGLCHVTIAGSGKRADLAPVATPPNVEYASPA